MSTTGNAAGCDLVCDRSCSPLFLPLNFIRELTVFFLTCRNVAEQEARPNCFNSLSNTIPTKGKVDLMSPPIKCGRKLTFESAWSASLPTTRCESQKTGIIREHHPNLPICIEVQSSLTNNLNMHAENNHRVWVIKHSGMGDINKWEIIFGKTSVKNLRGSRHNVEWTMFSQRTSLGFTNGGELPKNPNTVECKNTPVIWQPYNDQTLLHDVNTTGRYLRENYLIVK